MTSGDDTQRPPSGNVHLASSSTDGVIYRAWKVWFVRVGLTIFMAGLLVAAGAVIGRLTVGQEGPAAQSSLQGAVQSWTCSMHPNIKLPKPGQCPICFMDLVPVRVGSGDDEGAPRLSLSERARSLAAVATSLVEYRELVHDVRLVGKIAADETRITYVSSYFPGRLDRLFVNYTGILVNEGDHLAEVYSPDLLVAQEEFLLALEAQEKSPPSSREDDFARRSAETLLAAAQRKLELWGIPEDEIERLRRERRASDRMRIDAPVTGWVSDRNGYPGMYTETGMRLFTLTDLRVVWVLLDAYEMDLGLLRYGQTVEFEAEACPGRVFAGRIAYIDPTLTESSRTVKVRLNVPNESLQLRPGMFLRARLQVRLGEGGQVIEPSLVGKWISPMHPEIVKDGPGKCDVCGMDLVPAESLGFAPPSAPAATLLAVPRTAVLLTGRRAVVYVESKSDSGDTFYEGREVILGPRAGDFYVVRSGLAEGERVVTRGALNIDSALQIQARPSMMQPEGLAATTEGVHPGDAADERALPAAASRDVRGAMYHQHMRPVVDAVLRLTDTLAMDDATAAAGQLALVRTALGGAAPHGLEGDDADLFREQVEDLRAALPAGEQPPLEAIRERLPALTSAVETYLRTFGHDREKPLVRIFCPMAFDNRGAGWLSIDDEVRNPYFGEMMYRCGQRRGAIAPSGKEER